MVSSVFAIVVRDGEYGDCPSCPQSDGVFVRAVPMVGNEQCGCSYDDW